MSYAKVLVAAVCCFLLVDCKMKVVDLSHPLHPDARSWPTNKRFELFVTHNGSWGDVEWVGANDIYLAEHTGTHVDAPTHFSKNGGTWQADDIPVDRLVGPLVQLEMVEKAKSNRDYLVTAEDVLDWEKKFGTIPKGAIVMMHFGWDKYWHDINILFGTSTPNDTTTFHFPGLGMDAAKILVDREIAGVGTDCPSVDYGPSLDYPTHVYILPKNIYMMEHVANMDNLPHGGEGVTVVVGVLKIERGTGSPARIIALVNDEMKTSSAKMIAPALASCLIVLLGLILL